MSGSPASWGTGRLGKCATFSNNTANYILFNGSDYRFTTEDFSWAFWLKKDFSSKTASNMWAFTLGRVAAGGYGYGLKITSTTNIMAQFGDAVMDISGCPDNTWHHVAFTRNGSKLSIYLDGVLKSSMTLSGTVPTYTEALGLSIGTYYYNNSGTVTHANPLIGSIQDFRLYDHALSQKEVMELAKGLMLHLPMYCGFPGIGKNLCAGWEAMQAKSLGQYYSSLITDNNFFGLKVGDTYTYRIKITAPSTKGVKARVQYYTDGNTRTGPTSTVTVAAGTTGYSYLTDTITEAKRAYTRMELLITSADTSVTSTDTVYVGEVKLELGSTATPWSPNGSTGGYAIKDCSGYQNSIGITGTVPTEISDGPRYGSSARFDGAGACLWPSPDPIKSTTTEFTISLWFKTTTVSATQCIWNGRTTTGASVAIFIINSTFRIDDSTQTTISAGLTANTWYHLALTWKSGGNKVTYLNGTQISSVTAGTLSKSNTNASIGRSSSADSIASSNYFTGQMSDFRIYATALTAAQIKELYNSPISVANTGACLSGQFTEGASGIAFGKTGVVNCSNISSLPVKYDNSILIEPDGTAWAHIGHHADPATYKFASGDPFSTGVWKDARRFLDPSICNNVDKWEFLVVQKKTTDGSVERYRWSQPVNPNTSNYSGTVASTITRYGTADGYNSSSYGGMYYNDGSNSYYVCNNGVSGNWYGAIGCWNDFQTGIPAYNGGSIKDGGYTDLYIRIDNVVWTSGLAKCSLDKAGKSVLSPEFIEQ